MALLQNTVLIPTQRNMQVGEVVKMCTLMHLFCLGQAAFAAEISVTSHLLGLRERYIAGATLLSSSGAALGRLRLSMSES